MFKSADAVVIIHYVPHGAAAEAVCKDLPHLYKCLEIDCLFDKVENFLRQHKTSLVPQQQRPVSSGGSVIQHLCIKGHPSFPDILQGISFVQPPHNRIENHRVHRKIKSAQQIIEMRFQAVLFTEGFFSHTTVPGAQLTNKKWPKSKAQQRSSQLQKITVSIDLRIRGLNAVRISGKV
ncbi:MAG: hypothetical protein WBV95_05115 [Desulfobacterales bacterium]